MVGHSLPKQVWAGHSHVGYGTWLGWHAQIYLGVSLDRTWLVAIRPAKADRSPRRFAPRDDGSS